MYEAKTNINKKKDIVINFIFFLKKLCIIRLLFIGLTFLRTVNYILPIESPLFSPFERS